MSYGLEYWQSRCWSLWLLEIWVRGTVMLSLLLLRCLHLDLQFLVRLAIMVIGFFDFRILGLRGLLRLGYIWDLLFGYQCILW